MKIRPLHKTLAGNYVSNDKKWFFVGKNLDSRRNREWQVYQRMLDGKFYSDTPYFFKTYFTLRSLINSLEKANKA